MMEDKQYKCVILKGDFSDMGKHVLLPFGMTLCGLPTVDADKEAFPSLKHKNFEDMISEYTVEEPWEITCEKCIKVLDLVQKGEAARKAKRN